MSGEIFNPGSLPGPEDILRREMTNGITVLARRNPHSRAVSLTGYLEAGCQVDPEEKLGLSNFTAAGLMRGTRRRTHSQIFRQLEDVAAGLSFTGGTHTTGFSGRCLVEDLPMLLSLLAEALQEPVFPLRQIGRLRTAILTSLDLQFQDSQDRAGMAFDEIVYPGHPYSRPDEGWPETVRRIRRRDLQRFHQRYFGPAGMRLAIVGGLDPEEAWQLVEDTLGGWQNPAQINMPQLPDWQPLDARQDARIPMEEKSQTDLILGTGGPPRSSADFLPVVVGNQILGNFGMMGRLGEHLRTQAGLAYYVYSNFGASPGPGAWYAAAGVAPEDLERAIGIILGEIGRFISEPVSAQELADVQSHLIGSVPLSLESNSGVASLLLYIERHQLGLDYLHRYPTLIQAITAKDILAAASRYLKPDRLAVVAAGKLEEEDDE